MRSAVGSVGLVGIDSGSDFMSDMAFFTSEVDSLPRDDVGIDQLPKKKASP